MSEIPTTLSAPLGAVIGVTRGLDDEDLVDELVAVEAQIRAAQARRLAVCAVIQERIAQLGYSVQGTADQIAVSLGISPRSADHVLGDAISIVGRPLVWDALFGGRIDLPKARLIVDGLESFGGIPRCEMELDAIAYGQTHTAHELRKYLIRLTCDGDPGEVLRKEALKKRGVSLIPAAHGMADIVMRLSMEHADVFYERLTQLAKRDDCPDPHQEGDERTLDQRRADAMVGFLDDTTEVSVHVDVAISADALIGEDHSDALLGKHGAVPASLARHLAWSPDARWRRLVCDPITGTLIAANAETYKVPERVKRVVRLRDRTCRFPGCCRPAEYTDTDHITPWSKGGKTNAIDLGGECRRHHLVKTHSAWKVRHDRTSPRHEMYWTSPLGTRHTTTAYPYLRRKRAAGQAV